MTEKHYLGLMSGTSMDGINAAIVGFEQQSLEIVKTVYTPYSTELKASLGKIVTPNWTGTLESLLSIGHLIGETFVEAARQVLAPPLKKPIAAIGLHGQTLRHQPTGAHPNSWQLGDPNLIAEHTGITTIADWRRRDMAAGGQGAPLTPAFHAAVFRGKDDRAIVNLGGIANITLLPAKSDSVRGFDTGPANTLLDGWIYKHLKRGYDKDGAWAQSGAVIPSLLKQMLRTDYFSAPPPKSTGREFWNLGWLQQQLDIHGHQLAPADVQSTLTELTATSIVNAIATFAPTTQEIYLCGGGAHNRYLLQRMRILSPQITVESTNTLGIDPEFVEAIAFAWLAKQTLEGRPVNLSPITGAKGRRILGAIYPCRT